MKHTPPASIIANDPLEKRIEDKIALLTKMDSDIPAITIIHDLRNTSVLYMSAKGLKILGVTLDKLKEMGPDYHDRFFNPIYASVYVPKIIGLLERNNNDEIISYFQQVRSSPDKDWTWYLSCSKIFMRDDEGKPLLLISNAVPMDTEHYVEAAKAKRLMEENTFLRNNHHLFNTLSKREKEILKMMAMGDSSLKISKKLFISEMTANTHRRNIKRKLNIESNYDITRFAQAFDLV